MKRICIITTAHPAEDNRIYHKEITTLSDNYEIAYITTGNIATHSEGLRIINVGYFGGKLGKRILINFAAFREALKLESDIYHFHDFDFIIWAVLVRLIKRKPVIYDVHEDNPAVVKTRGYVNSSWLKSILSLAVRSIEMFSARFFTGLIVVNESLKKRFSKLGKEMIIIPNYPIKKLFDRFTAHKTLSKSPKLIHIGDLNKVRGAEIIFNELNDLDFTNVSLVVIGDIKPADFRQDLLEKYPNVVVRETGKLRYEETLEEAYKGDVGLIGYLPLPNHIDSSPNKIFEYMGLGLPILATNIDKYKKYVTSSRAGRCYDPGKKGDMGAALKEILAPNNYQKFSVNGQKAFLEKYNWDKEAQKLLNLYRSILGERQ